MKQETLEKAAENYAHNYFDMHETNNYKALKQGFEIGAKWQQENSYNDKKEFAINFSRFLELLKINHPELYWSKNMNELLKIYENENRG